MLARAGDAALTAASTQANAPQTVQLL